MHIDSVVFYSNDIELSKTFYVDVLGATVEYQQGDAYVSLQFPGDTRLGICRTHHGRELPGAQTLIFAVQDPKQLAASFREQNIVFCDEYQEFEWGRIFSVFDPDHNKIEFIERH